MPMWRMKFFISVLQIVNRHLGIGGNMPIQIVESDKQTTGQPTLEHLSLETAEKVVGFHRTFPEYGPTPLREMKALADHLDVAKIYIKDESYRFGLNAFKVLGGSYAIGNYIAARLGEPIENLSYDRLVSPEIKERLGKLTFVSATDGNHGRGIAWTVSKLGQDSVIYMPKGSARERLENIRAEGARASITDLNYDDAVRLADTHARERGWVLVQDTSWPGYEEIPMHIIQGYMTLAYEIHQQLENVKPTHVFLQAGVGAFASAVTGFMTSVYGPEKPVITIVEPSEAACIYKTAKANDGDIHVVDGDMDTIMAGLACGEPVTVGIDILRHYAEFYLSCDDYVAAQGMRVLAAPTGQDARIISGESGAAGFGAAYEILTNPALASLKERLGIDATSVLLFVNTEGDTDKMNYRRIVWDGLYPRP